MQEAKPHKSYQALAYTMTRELFRGLKEVSLGLINAAEKVLLNNHSDFIYKPIAEK